jgi:glycosyltransferase involved in cell wall biosynthesis
MRQERKFRIAYLSGPSEAANVYREWSQSLAQNYFGSNYMKQFFQVCRDLDAEAYIITTVPGQHSLFKQEGFVIENFPLPSGYAGFSYHLAMAGWFARLAPKLARYRSDVLIATANQNYWWLLFFLRYLRVPVIPSFHCVLWPKFGQTRASWRALLQLNRLLVLNNVKTALVASKDIARQFQKLLGKTRVDVLEHLPTYNPSQFAAIPSPAALPRTPFRIFFAGRMEKNKGIYDLIEIARRLKTERPGLFRIDLCGDGGELGAARDLIKRLDLDDVVVCHGYLNSEEISAVLGASHVVIVPTTSEFEEGFNMVCAEGVLAGRPVITSAVCPALEYIRAAAVEVPPDDVGQYYKAIINFYDDAELYNQKQTSCATVQAQFYDLKNSWAEKLKIALNVRTRA